MNRRSLRSATPVVKLGEGPAESQVLRIGRLAGEGPSRSLVTLHGKDNSGRASPHLVQPM